MNDKEHAERIRIDAKRLAATMNEAAEAGLLMSIKLESCAMQTFENGDVKKTAWHPTVSVWRTQHA
jgi:hypothetical protein